MRAKKLIEKKYQLELKKFDVMTIVLVESYGALE